MSDNIDSQNFSSGDYYGMMPPQGSFVGDYDYLQKRPTSAGWVEGDEGFVQQTFLGASIINFNLSAGFNDSPNTLNVSLVPDELNKSDGTPLGIGDDIYHSGEYDCFSPPPIGAPVFFKFGKNFASIPQAFARSYEKIYTPQYKTVGATRNPPLILSDKEFQDTKNKRMVKRSDMDKAGPDFDDGIRLIRNDHVLRQDSGYEDQKPTLGYDDSKPPQPTPDTYFVDNSDIHTDILQKFDRTRVGSRGKDHFVFGGILSSYSESKTANGNPIFSVSVVDPKEILSNCTLILNDYGQTTFNNKNLFNVYGFLEHEPSVNVKESLVDSSQKINIYTKHDTIEESDDYSSDINLKDCYLLRHSLDDPNRRDFNNLSSMKIGQRIRKPIRDESPKLADCEYWFPITGRGMSRRTEKGIPIYRVIQSLEFLNYFSPQEYEDNGFCGSIDFRGYKFALNIRGIKDLFLPENIMDKYYPEYFRGCRSIDNLMNVLKDVYIESDDISILDLVQEMASVFNQDFVVELLPPVDKNYLTHLQLTEDDELYELYEISEYNEQVIEYIKAGETKKFLDENGNIVSSEDPATGNPKKYTENDLIAGIICVSFIEKPKQPSYNSIANQIAIQDYEDANIGFDLVNETTDKFLVGAQEVDLYFFSSHKDRDEHLNIVSKLGPENSFYYGSSADGLLALREREKWSIKESLKQQVLPFYGELGEGIASIPIGDGPFQQILLNAESLNAFGIGEYYLTTEMELRAAMVSFEQWAEFLLKYNNRYVEGFVASEEDSINPNYPFPAPSDEDVQKMKDRVALVSSNGEVEDKINNDIDRLRCGVSVPRSVFVSNKNYYSSAIKQKRGVDEVGVAINIAEDEKKENLPANPCFPPYGYPLYYGRASAIGLLRPSDISKLANNAEVIQPAIQPFIDAKIKDGKTISSLSDSEIKKLCENNVAKFASEKRREFIDDMKSKIDENLTATEKKEKLDEIKRKADDIYKEYKTLLERFCATSNLDWEFIKQKFIESNGNFLGFVYNLIRINQKNAKKVHDFLRGIADEHLGKSFLVKIPQKTNLSYSAKVETNQVAPDNGMFVTKGPFGFKPIYQSGKVVPKNKNTEFLPYQDFLFIEHKDSIGRDPSKNVAEPFLRFNPPVIDNVGTKSFDGADIESGLTYIEGIDLNTVISYDPKIVNTGVTGGSQRYWSNPDSIKTQDEKERAYSEGAMTPTYNPISNQWDFNYLPQDKGGWFNFEIGQASLVDSMLYPIDPNKLKTQTNRISPYVIYNNSQTLHFKGANKLSVVQEKVEGKFKEGNPTEFFPSVKRMDLCTILDNVGIEESQLDKPLSSYISDTVQKQDVNSPYLQEHTAFVKCSVDEKLYFAPRFCIYPNLPVSSNGFKLKNIEPSALDYITEDAVRDGVEDLDAFPTGSKLLQTSFINTVFGPSDDKPETKDVISLEYADVSYCLKGNINEPETLPNGDPNPDAPKEIEIERKKTLIIESKPSLNSEHVYALVKLSARPIPIFDRRFSDGPKRSTNPVTVAKIWNRDTIKGGGPWNSSLAYPPALTQGIEEEKIKYISKIDQDLDYVPVGEVLPLANPELLIDFIHPSPVIPDTIAIPLLSKDRCYGPWRSNALFEAYNRNNPRTSGCYGVFQNIGGKVEYKKDESFSPWAFDGYENMNRAGEIEVAFSNSLLLFTEKGNYTVPGIPKNIQIGRPLFNNSPLVDSISLSVDANTVKTTVSLEMFSVKYGRTKKQKQEQLAKLTREEKLRVQNRNRLIRNDAQRPIFSNDLKELVSKVGVGEISPTEDFSGLERKQTVYDSLVASVVPTKIDSIVVDPLSQEKVAKSKSVIKTSNTASFQYKDYLQEMQRNYTDVNELNNSLQRTGGSLLNDIYFPFDESVYNPYMTNMPYVDIDSITRRTS